MADTATVTIKVPIFNFDIVQGQDLTIPVKYEITGIPDTMEGAALEMQIRPSDYSKPIDTLTVANGRIVITGVNSFNLVFPRLVTTAWKVTSPKTNFIHGLEITGPVVSNRIFDGVVSVNRERVR